MSRLELILPYPPIYFSFLSVGLSKGVRAYPGIPIRPRSPRSWTVDFVMRSSQILLSSIASVALAAPASVSAECNRQGLLDAADAYVAAQTAGSVSPLQKFLGADAAYVENNKDTDLSKSVILTALKIDNRRTNVDMVQCATYTEIISAGTPPFVIGTQIHHAADGKVKLVDTIASTTNSWIFDAKKTLQYVQQEKWDLIPEAKWDNRAVIQAAGDAYLDLLEQRDGREHHSLGTPCTRLEGRRTRARGSRTIPASPGSPAITTRRRTRTGAMSSTRRWAP